MGDLPLRPLGRHVLLRLDPDENYESATVVAIGGGVPVSYGIELYSRVLFSSCDVVRTYEDDKSREDILDYEPAPGVDDDDEYYIAKYVLIDAGHICAMLVKNKE
jgi:hypothetical protein